MADATILILDDDEALLVVLTLLIRREGYRVLTAATAEEALSVLERERVSVAIVDQNLPDLPGVDVLKRLRQRWPDTIRIMLTASADTRTAVAAINGGHVYRYMTKPWDNEEFRAVLRESVQYHDLLRENRRLYELSVSQAIQLRAMNEALEKKVAERTAEIAGKNLQLEENLLDVIRLLTGVQELRNSSMAGRAQRVAEAARWLAHAVHLTESEQRDVELAASLHDIGKLGMPDRVFHKDTYSLSREDQELIKQSPLLGAALLSTIPSLTTVARLVRHQGEWYNGRGYPDGLAGESIPIGARIIALVDAYEKYGGERRVLLQGEGHRFDPRLVREFIRYLDERRVAAQSGTEMRVDPAELREGMVLTRDLYTGRGLLLATSGKEVDRPTLDKIRNFNRADPIQGRVYVHV
ncbi:MAG: response regulator [Anaerolineales bacterium]|nr:response regulator [Anaerolineales bacterium]